MYRPAVLSMLLSALMPATQADSHVAVQNNAVTVASGQKLVAYPRSYFDRYQPLTALDMVRQVPGFQLENNIDVRGYSDALGNLLINDRRPTAKQDQPLDILARIPADTVERIELIRSQVRDINMLGQSSLVNVIIRENVRAAVQWDAYIRKTFRYGGITPKASFSLTHQWRDIDYNLGLGFRRSRVGKDGTEDILGSDNTPIEARSQGRDNLNTFIYGNLNASSWFGNTFVQINSNFNWVEHIWERYSIRVPEDPSAISQQRLTGRDSQDPEFELGLDLERHLAAELEA